LLGQQHLQVLRTLKQAEQPVKDGLHRTAPYGMVSQGFAFSTDAGYVLTAKGASVLYLYDEVTEAERELLMRMYRAQKENRPVAMDQEAAQCVDKLIYAELIDVDGGYLTLTEYALDVWEGWVQFWDLKRQQHAAKQKLKKAKAAANGAAPIETESTVQDMHVAHAATVAVAVPPRSLRTSARLNVPNVFTGRS
jgi:hypothetical protein